MRAVLIASGRSAGAAAMLERRPPPLVPLVDRPFLQHVVEFLVRRGVAQFDFVLSEKPETIEQFLGDGERWGVRFTFHLAADPARPYGPLRAVDLGSNGETPIIFGHADRLPPFPVARLRHERALPALYFWNDRAGAGPRRRWTGWASLAPRHLRGLPRWATEEDLDAHFLKVMECEGEWCEVGRPLCVQTYRDVIAAHRAVLEGEFPGLLVAAREKSRRGWFARNAKVHPTARVFPPVYVGENSIVGAGVQLGPQATVGRDCVLDANCRVANAVVLPDSYVGQSLDLSDVIVARDMLIDGWAGTALTVRHSAVLADLAAPWHKAAVFALERASALALLGLASPVLLAVALWLRMRRRGPVLHRRLAVRLPAPADPAAWRTFMLWSFTPSKGELGSPEGGPPCSVGGLLLRVMPALVNVARGDLGLVGLPARTPEEIQALPADWREVYLSGRAGVVTEAAVRCAERPTPDELYAAEALHVRLGSGRRKLAALVGYFARCLFRYAPRQRG
jgi:mannose-1-phosphate guanylyltransferase